MNYVKRPANYPKDDIYNVIEKYIKVNNKARTE